MLFSRQNGWNWSATEETAPLQDDNSKHGVIELTDFMSVMKSSYVQEALRDLQDDSISAFPSCSCGGSAYDLYLCGLVDEVGWETLRKTIHSYHDGTYTPTKRYEPNG